MDYKAFKEQMFLENIRNIKQKRPFSSTYRLLLLLFISLPIVNFVGCCVYSFTGASVPKHLKTIAIPIAEDKSGSGEPGMRELLTTTLTQKFVDDNTLQVASKTNADAILDCTVISLTDAPQVVSPGETVQTRRITISVQVVYKDLVERKTIFNKTFSNSGDYPANGTTVDRNNAIQSAINNISEDILLAVVSGW